MDQPSTSTAIQKQEVSKIVNEQALGKNSTDFLKRIARKTEEDKESIDKLPPMSPIEYAARCTGMHKVTLETMLHTKDTPKVEVKEVNRQSINDELTFMYISKMCIPTPTQLFDAVHQILPNYVDIDYFKKLLVKMGYVFYKFPGQKALRVMEKKSVTFERYKYVKSIQQYRIDNVPIYYFGATKLGRQEYLQENAMCSVFFIVKDATIHNLQITNECSFKNLKFWLEQFNLHSLPPGSVCVLDNSEVYGETLIEAPTVTSLKIHMFNWLDVHDIPYNDNMTKMELIDLIENYTDTEESNSDIDKMFMSHDLKVLKIPNNAAELSVANLCLQYLKENVITKEKSIRDAFNALSEPLKLIVACVQQTEQRLLEEYMKLDDILDYIVLNTKNMVSPEDDENEDNTTIPTFSDSD